MASVADMAQEAPLSPDTNELQQHSLHHLVRYTRGSSTGEPMYGPDEELYYHPSQSSTLYDSSITPQQPVTSQSDGKPECGDGIPYSQSEHYNDASSSTFHHGTSAIPRSGYYDIETPSYIGVSAIPTNERDSTPATPQSKCEDVSRKTRSGRLVHRTASPHTGRDDAAKSRVSKSPRARAPRQKSSNSKAPKITGPLSELTKDMTVVPLRDMEAWVHRSDEVRQKEVEKRNGYVTRPMNSFMLYRSAYAERTKAWCVQNNHQVVSSVSGESWPLEPEEVREKYNELARIERENHARAHPTYKFSPSKGSAFRNKKKEQFSEDESSGESDAEDGDNEWRPRKGRRGKPQSRDSSNPLSESFIPQQAYTHEDLETQIKYDEYGMPVWEPQPLLVAATDPYGQYYYSYPSAVTAYTLPHDIEELGWQQIDATMPFYEGMPTAIPGFTNSDLLTLQSHEQQHMEQEPNVDPALLQLGESSGTSHQRLSAFFEDNTAHYAQHQSQFSGWMR